MHNPGVAAFKYYVGIASLAQVATREDRVCVLNILGGESSDVTPVGHAWSGGNVVFGTSPGRRGQSLQTDIGDVPVYNNVLEGLSDGHRFNCGVVYLPPSAARDGVAELIRVNPDLRKVFIITEKISVHDAREIRAMGQQNGIDVFGANCLGVADSWNQVRIGGGLGGDRPGDSLRKGSIAILSNSGGFTTTIAQYLRMAGWGTTTLISSGKDVYIHFAAPEFAFALANDARTKAAVLYAEPGGYYERDADFTKPVVACIVGRWKSRLTRAVGHAGAMSGGADDAAAKERWFMEKLGVDAIYTLADPAFSARGAIVTNIAHIAQAMTDVMRANGVRPDFEPEGSTELKPWFASNATLALPPELDLPVVRAMPPYGEQIEALDRRIGALFPREPLKDASGASSMDAKTQVTSLFGYTMLQAAELPFEANACLALLHEPGGERDRALMHVGVAAHVPLHGTVALQAAQASRAAGNSPNTVMAAAVSLLGPAGQAPARRAMSAMIDVFTHANIRSAFDLPQAAIPAWSADPALFWTDAPDPLAQSMLRALDTRGVDSAFVRFLRAREGFATRDAVLAAIACSLAWGPLMRKRISRVTAESLPWWLQIAGTAIGASAAAEAHGPGSFRGVPLDEILQQWDLGEVAFAALLGERPRADDLFAFEALTGLLLSNGPGAISAQGAKGAVSADGPDDPAHVQLNKCAIGFLTHTGYTHGGNGYEGIEFLMESFDGASLDDPADARHGLDLEGLAARRVADYAAYKTRRRNEGEETRKIPGVNHPVFKDKPVNVDPREAFIHELFERRGEYNVFHEYYRVLVRKLFEEGVSRNVYCVNIDAVIASLLLKMLWRGLGKGHHDPHMPETAAFTVFLYPRLLGCAAEIDDHLNRGRSMDTRTPASQCRFVA
jgi:succinyl-CoA synthetase alpha subunit